MAQQVKAVRRSIKTEKLIVRISPQLKMQVINQCHRSGKSLTGYLTSLIENDLTKK